MKKLSKALLIVGLLCSILLGGCGNENSSFSELMASKKNGSQQTPWGEKTAESLAKKNQEAERESTVKAETYPTLTEVIQENGYNRADLEYPNFEELSVGTIYGGESHKYVLFDSNGLVHHVFENDVTIISGFYNGMCMTSTCMMAQEDGTIFWPSYIPEDEVLVSYLKNDCGTLLWSVKQEDTLEGSKTILTAWDTLTGSIRFQCDTTQQEFAEMYQSPTELFRMLTQNFDYIVYKGGGTYWIRDAKVSVNIYKGTDEASEKYTLSTTGGNGTMMSITVKNGNLEELPEWKGVISKRSCYPVLSEELIFMQAWRNVGNGEEFPEGFYDIHLNRIIDLSQYDIRPINENSEPRFMNGYAALQLRNPDGVLFWGVIDKSGNWVTEPQKGTVKYVFPTADGLLISTCEENSELYQTYKQDGTRLENWDGLEFGGYYSYVESGTYGYGSCEVYDGFLYTNVSGHVAKIGSDGEVDLLS